MDAPFSNEPIAVDHLPRLADDAFVSVDRRYVWGGLAGIVIATLVVVGLAGLIVWRSDAVVVPLLLAAGVVVLLVAIAVVAVVESRRLAYQLRERDLSVRSGAFRHRVETIPFSRIQHVSVGRGVLERSLGLATLKVSSAGPDFAVPGLSPADAERIKAAIAERAALESEVDDGFDGDASHLEPPSPAIAPTPSSPPAPRPPGSPPASPPWPAP
jgi:membrane protein YdbS with pleckstrin-like domain